MKRPRPGANVFFFLLATLAVVDATELQAMTLLIALIATIAACLPDNSD